MIAAKQKDLVKHYGMVEEYIYTTQKASLAIIYTLKILFLVAS